MHDSLPYGFEFERDCLLDLAFRIQSITPVVSSLTVYPVNLYLLLVETPRMMTEIRAAYLANLLTLIYCDWVFNYFAGLYLLPPYGLFYCEGPLCRLNLDKSTVVIFLGIAIMCCIPTYYVLMMRMHQMIVRHTASRWRIPWKLELTMYIGLLIVAIANVAGFAIFCRDVPNHVSLIERGGLHIIYSEPGKTSAFVHEVQIFIGSFAVFMPPLMFFAAHALFTLNQNASQAFSSKTQALTRQLFDIFNFQLRGAMIFFVVPQSFIMAAGIIDTRNTFSRPMFALLRFTAVILFSLNPAQFATVFILRNSTHRTILLKRLRQTRVFAIIRQLVGTQQNPKVTVTEISARA